MAKFTKQAIKARNIIAEHIEKENKEAIIKKALQSNKDRLIKEGWQGLNI